MKYASLIEELKIDCKGCSGLCCVALYCSKVDGFPEDKEANVPCRHLEGDFRCDMHTELGKKGMKGCIHYECFGAGQKVTKMYQAIGNWRSTPEHREEIYELFLKVYQLHQMRWYLIDASGLELPQELGRECDWLIGENVRMAGGPAEVLLGLDITAYRERTNQLLKAVTKHIAKGPKAPHKNFFGKNFKASNLEGRDFSMAMMIAANLANCNLRGANFLGADLRDTNVCGADLSGSVFLTQMQLNATKGDHRTKLPQRLSQPSTW
ncbi:MAG: pentapeptide repeat-containing protein [Cellulosilyticaceae bacterium]